MHTHTPKDKHEGVKHEEPAELRPIHGGDEHEFICHFRTWVY